MPKILHFPIFCFLLFLRPLLFVVCLTYTNGILNVTQRINDTPPPLSNINYYPVCEYMFWCHCHKFIYIANIIRSENSIKISTKNIQSFTLSTLDIHFFFLPLSKLSNIYTDMHSSYMQRQTLKILLSLIRYCNL